MKSFPYPFFRELRAAHNLPVTDAICITGMTPGLEIKGSAERVTGEMVSGNVTRRLASVLIWAVSLSPPMNPPGADRVAVLSYGFWKRRFAADKRLLSSIIHLNTVPIVVIGIAPPGFSGMSAENSPDVRVPITMQKEMYRDATSMLDQRDDWWLTVVARLRPEAASRQAEAALTALVKTYMNPAGAATPYVRRVLDSEQVHLLPAATGIVSRTKNFAKQLFVLMWLVAVVLLIACVNVANLCLARAAARQREIAVRRAIGAGRARLIRQLLTECLALSVAGGWLGILFGLTPAIQSTGAALTPALKADQRIAGGTRVFWRKLLTCAQVALSVLLLIGADLFLKSVATLRSVDTGFNRDNVLVCRWTQVSPHTIRPAASPITARRRRVLRPYLGSSTRASPILSPDRVAAAASGSKALLRRKVTRGKSKHSRTRLLHDASYPHPPGTRLRTPR